MEGEVYVYVPITGTNMMAAGESVTGSTGDVEGGTILGATIRWVLPGGISGQGTWGYLLKPMGNDGVPNTDEDVMAHLEAQNLEVGSEEARTEISKLVMEYANRVLINDDNLDPDYNWGAFNQRFGSCIVS